MLKWPPQSPVPPNHGSGAPIADAPSQNATLWLAQAEGGEGGEAGAVANATPAVTYLSRLAIVEGHLRAVLDLHRKGLVDEAVGLSCHPEAEMMDDVRADLAAHGAADITPRNDSVFGHPGTRRPPVRGRGGPCHCPQPCHRPCRPARPPTAPLPPWPRAGSAFGDMSLTTNQVRDPAILLAVAARLDLIASTVL